MTLRAKPVVNRPHRSSREGESRRNFYLNVGFGLAVVLAVLILIGVVAVTWYSQHLAAAASVDGQTITRDDFTERAQIELWRLQQQTDRVNAAVAAGRLTSAEGQQRVQSLQSQASSQSLAPIVVEDLVDARIQSKLAAEEGITVTPEQVDAKITEEATTPEERHAWLIAVAPETDEGKDEPTAEQKAAAKKIADQALADITSGAKKWEDVAKSVSTDSSKSSGGDLGWIAKDAAEDQAFIDAVFDAEQDKPTAVIETADGTYEIGRVTEISPASVDSAWQQKLTATGIKLEAYRKVVESEVVKQALTDKAVAAAEASTKQRHIRELAIQAPDDPPSDKAVKVRHILYSPNDNASAAEQLSADDPAWTVAKLAAEKDLEILKKDPSKFDEIARTDSDDESSQGETGNGGKLPYVDDNGAFVSEFSDAVLNKPELKPGDLVGPIRSPFGWHIIQIMYRPPDIDEMKKLRDQAAGGADFAQLARDYSDGPESGKGGDKGWVGLGLIDNRLWRAIEAAPLKGLSEIVEIKSAGVFLYQVIEERTQKPDADQLETIKARAFQNWYGEKKDAVTITRPILDELDQGQGQ
jgi:parvulin-like peptidyl-prolyl isomerase